MVDYPFNREDVINALNRILEVELAGVVRYTHYSFMIFGPNRIPIVQWFREQANESLLHAQQAGELVTHLGGHPSLEIGELLETYSHDLMDILKEARAHESRAIVLYRELLELVKDKSIMIEEFARGMVHQEEQDLGEVEKMIGQPGAPCSH